MSDVKEETSKAETTPEQKQIAITNPPEAELPTIEDLKKQAEGVLSEAAGLAAAIIVGEIARDNPAGGAVKPAPEPIGFAPRYASGEEERRLETVLTEAEKEEKRKEVFELLKRKAQNESAIKRLNDHYKAEIKNDGNKIAELREIVEAGKEFRAVKCLRFSDFSRRIVTVFRNDSEAVVERRGLKEDELPRLKQQTLPFEGPTAGGSTTPPEASSVNVKEETPANSAAVEQLIFAVEAEIHQTAKEQEAQPTTSGALRLVALDNELNALRGEMKEALRLEQQAAKKKKAERVEKAAKKAEGAPVDLLVGCRVKDKTISFYLGGVEQQVIDFRKKAATALVSFLVKRQGGALKLIDSMTSYPTSFSKRTVQRYASGEAVVPEDFLRGIAECFPALVLKEFSILESQLTPA